MLRQRWPAPSQPRPVVFIGAGGIVEDAHLPAYQALGIPVVGFFDVDTQRARTMAHRHGGRAFDAFPEPPDAAAWVYDVAVPPEHVESTLAQVPQGAAVLIQKPMGRTLAEATRIRSLARSRGLVAALNFQLRFSPMLLAVQDARDQGWFGTITELDVRVQCHMPWDKWPFLFGLERMELALHSIHYLDALRAIQGDAAGVHAVTLPHPECPELASTRSSVLLDYGPDVRACLSVNHHHRFGTRFGASQLLVEGTSGAAVVKMGVNLDYPRGEPDELWLGRVGETEWEAVRLEGGWFPDAFRGPMSNLQRFIAGEDEVLVTRLDDAWKTMALVEACYDSAARPLTPVPPDPEAT